MKPEIIKSHHPIQHKIPILKKPKNVTPYRREGKKFYISDKRDLTSHNNPESKHDRKRRLLIESLTLKSTVASMTPNCDDHGLEIATKLRSDIKKVFKSTKLTEITTKTLLATLNSNRNLPWHTFNGDKGFSARQLCSTLKVFGIHSQGIKFDGRNLKGYRAEWFITATSSKRNSISTTKKQSR